eukprot:6690765-Pyramimonas_sp.AAC.1
MRRQPLENPRPCRNTGLGTSNAAGQRDWCVLTIRNRAIISFLGLQRRESTRLSRADICIPCQNTIPGTLTERFFCDIAAR